MGLGCWAIGGPFYDRGGWMGYGAVDDSESRRALARGLDLGVTLIDTASVYGCGHSEKLIGDAIAGRRDGVVIVGKIGYAFDAERRVVIGPDPSREGLRASCEATLARLRTDYLDVLQLHLFDLPIERALEVRETLETLVNEGKVRHYGWCSEDPVRTEQFASGAPHATLTTILWNVLEGDGRVLPVADRLDLGVTVRRPLCMGLLAGKLGASTKLAADDMRVRFGWDLKGGKQAAQLVRLAHIGEALRTGGRTLAQGAIGWLWARHPRVVPVPGFKTVAQVEENAGALRFGPLEPDAMAQIDDLLANG